MFTKIGYWLEISNNYADFIYQIFNLILACIVSSLILCCKYINSYIIHIQIIYNLVITHIYIIMNYH